MNLFAPEKGGPAPGDRGPAAAGVNGLSLGPKAPLPIVHLLTSFSSQNVQMASVTIGCDAKLGFMETVTEYKKPVRRIIMEKADVWKNCTAWYSRTTCPDCLARVERAT